jgi:hypothetical protein
LADDLTISGGVQVGSNYLDFEVGSNGVYTPAPGYGSFQVTSVRPGSVFATDGVTASETGQIQSLNEGTGSVSLPGYFITFSGMGGAATPLTVNNISPGAIGPFNLSDTTNGAEAVFEVQGYVGTNTSETFTAEFNMYFPGLTVADLFTNLPADTTYCANVDVGSTPTLCSPFAQSSAPEPGTWAMMGLGLTGTLVGYRTIRRETRG